MKWLKRKGYVREDLDAHASNEHEPLSPLEQLAMLAMQRGTFETIRDTTLRAPRESKATSSRIAVSTFTRPWRSRPMTTRGASDCVATERGRLSRLPSCAF
jgi:hypothetical protein